MKDIHLHLKYNPDTGEFIWIERKCGNRPTLKNIPAGCYKNDGGLYINYQKKCYPATHLAFFFMVGRLPLKGKFIDHIDKNRANNKWNNLREVTPQQNQLNRKDSSKYGPAIRLQNGTYYVRLTINKQRKSIGCASLEDAILTRETLLKEFIL